MMPSAKAPETVDSAIRQSCRRGDAVPLLHRQGRGRQDVGGVRGGRRVGGRGKRVLIVSTDPASNLDEVLATDLADVPRPVNGIANLHASNLDPEAAAAAYRDALVGPVSWGAA